MTYIDWSKFKSNAKGKHLENSKKAYEDFYSMIINNGHILESEYINATNKVEINFCCGHANHFITPHQYKKGVGCPKCKGNCTEQAKEDFFRMIKENGHEVLSEYKNNSTKVIVDFKCNHEPSEIKPSLYKSGQRCTSCSDRNLGQVKKDFEKLVKSNNHILLSEYIDAKTKVDIDFNCGHSIHSITPNDYKSGYRCPSCKNKGEGALNKLLLDMGVKFETQKTFDDLKCKRKLPYDFYLVDYNLLIELDGDHHRKEVYYKSNLTEEDRIRALNKLEDRIIKDKIKNDYARNNNMELLRIEYNNGKIELDKWKSLIIDKINGGKHD